MYVPPCRNCARNGTEERRGAVDVDADDRGPVRRLVPRQQVAGEAFAEPHREQQHADDPVQLTRVLVGAEEEHAPHVHEHQDDEDRRAPLVHAAHEPARPHVVRDVLDRRVRLLRIRLVVHREDHAGQRLHEERGEGRRAERREPVDVARHLPEEEVLDAADEAGPLLEPVERVQDHLLQLLRPCEPARRHRRRLVGRLHRIQPRFDAVDVLARERERPLVNLRRRARPVDVRHREGRADERGCRCGSRTRTGRARGPAGRRCGFPRCCTGRRGTGSRSPAIAIVGISVTSLKCFVLASSRRPFGCTGQPRCAQWLDRIVKLGCPFCRPLYRTYAVRRETSPAAGSVNHVATTNLSCGIVGDRPEVVILRPLLEEGGRDHETERGRGDEPADHSAQPERRELEELRAGEALLGRLRRQRRGVAGGSGGAAALRLDLGRLRELGSGCQVAHPEKGEREGDDRAETGDPPGDDQPDEEDDHADGEADGPQARPRDVRLFVVGLQRLRGDLTGTSGRRSTS